MMHSLLSFMPNKEDESVPDAENFIFFREAMRNKKYENFSTRTCSDDDVKRGNY